MSDSENPYSLSQDVLNKHQEQFIQALQEKGYFGELASSSEGKFFCCKIN
jgi:hypothetical protein